MGGHWRVCSKAQNGCSSNRGDQYADNHFPSQAAKYLKGDSSLWIHRQFADLQHFGWQDGYGAFSVSKSSVPDVIKYIQDQRQHHTKMSFEDEYVSLLRLHGIEYDDRYLFD
jgi:putative transposase